jgi:Sortase domain
VPEQQPRQRRDRAATGPRWLATVLTAASLLIAGCSSGVLGSQGARPEPSGGAAAAAPGPGRTGGGEAGTGGTHARVAVEPSGPAARPDPAVAGSAQPAFPPAGARGDVETIPLRPYEALPPSPPVSIRIPRIKVSSRLIRLGLEPGGTLEVPADFGRAGWFEAGPEPGQVGPAVIAGHVDSTDGPAVFYRLRELRKGDRIEVERADGRRLVFVVEGRGQFPKDEFPTEAVFGPVPWPALRLITCGGSFDRRAGSYRDNVIVSARLRDASPAASR